MFVQVFEQEEHKEKIYVPKFFTLPNASYFFSFLKMHFSASSTQVTPI
jgi:hypothetical protein